MMKGKQVLAEAWLAVMLLLLSLQPAWANVGAGSTRIPLTAFFVELYTVTQNVYVPLICLGAIVIGVVNYLTGIFRFGKLITTCFVVIGALGLGVAWFGETIGATVAIGLLA